MAEVTLVVNLDASLLREAEAIYSEIGLTLQEAIQLF